jgi:RNA polymerase sigma-70 factor (ECF subfamily)
MGVEEATPTGPDPEALLRRWRETGDAAALGALFDATAPELFGVALHLCRDPGRAEDALQETYLAALETLDRFEAGRRVVPWLVGILRNKLHEVRRFETRAAAPVRAFRRQDAPDPALEAATAEEEERVRAALAALPEPYREVAMLRWHHGLEPAEIAELKRMSPGTVRSLLHRALERLRRALVSLPALLFGSPDAPAPRGLGAVRDSVLASAPATAGVAGTVVVLGGIVMAKKSVVAAAAALLLLAGGAGVWTSMRPGNGGDGDPSAVAPSVPVAARSEPTAPAAPPAPAAGDSTTETIPPPVDLANCDRDLDLFGTVVDAKGVAVPGARLALFSYPLRRASILLTGDAFWVEEPGPSCVSSTDGSFAFRLRRGQLTHLRATKPGLAETVLPDCQAGERLRVVMEPPGRLFVRARDEQGKPVPGVRLLLLSTHLLHFTRLVRTGSTGSDGTCLFGDLPSGRVALWEVDHERLASPDHPSAVLSAGGEETVELTLLAGRVVRGSVVDAATGAPVAGATVGSSWMLRRPVLTKADGTFDYAGWLGGKGEELHAVAPGYGRAETEVPAEGGVEFRLHRGDEVMGRCLRADGTPAQGALVCAMGSFTDPRNQGFDSIHSSTGPDGRFRLATLRRDAPHVLVVLAPGHGRYLLDFPPRGGGPGTIDLGDLRLPAERSIEGRVVGADGVQMPDTRVELRGANADRGRRLPKGSEPIRSHYGAFETRRTDDLGRFRFPHLAPGSYELAAEVTGRPPAGATVELVEGKDSTGIELGTGTAAGDRPGTGECNLAVEVADESGAPVPGVRVSVHQGGRKARNDTDSDGRALIEGLGEGHAQVTALDVRGTGTVRYLTSTESIALPRPDPVRIVLRRRSEVSGTVVGPDGKALGGTMVCAREQAKGGQPQWYGQADSEGRFALEVPAGVPLTVQLPDGRSGAASLPLRGEVQGVIAPAQGVVLHARALKSDLALTVELRDADGNPVGEGHLMILPGGRRPEHRAFDAAGRIEMRDLAEDPFHALIQAPREPVNRAWTDLVPPAPRELVPGSGEVIVFRFRKGVPLRGRVVDEQGVPVAGAIVSVQTMDYATRWVIAGEDGSFAAPVLPGEKLRQLGAEKRLPDGNTLRVEHHEFEPGEGEVELRVVPWKDPSGR